MIIGIAGRKRSGKDTIANYLRDRHGYIVRKFAAPLKEALKSLFALSDEQVEGNQKEDADPRWGVSPRQLMQFFGTEVMQHKAQELLPEIQKSFAVKRMFIDDLPKKTVISDVRFKHEADELKKRGALLIKVVRGIPNSSNEHPSETEVDNLECDLVIQNNGTLEDLYAQVNEITRCPLYKFMFLTEDLLS